MMGVSCAKVFGTADPRIMTFGEAPPNPAMKK
jgi:hypothetical protein